MAENASGGAPGRKGERPSQRRKATLEEMRRAQKRQERRKTLLFVGIATGLALVLVGVSVWAVVNDRRNDAARKDPVAFGVPAAAAGCDPEQVDTTSGESQHVQAGVRIDYPEAPPASGRHEGTFETPPQPFYTPDDNVPVERLVHSLEHGHFILWYDPSLPQEQKDQIRDLVRRMRSGAEPQTGGKFFAAPWPGQAQERPPLPPGKNVVFTRWGGQNKAWRQYCSAVSGEAAKAFSVAHPFTDAPEAGGA